MILDSINHFTSTHNSGLWLKYLWLKCKNDYTFIYFPEKSYHNINNSRLDNINPPHKKCLKTLTKNVFES
jgi:hypothetical protein